MTEKLFAPEKIILDSGLTLLIEQIPYLNSASFGVWIHSGARHESPENAGISHFIEHMLFKGTKTRSAKEIADSFDMMGGRINAYTASEYTCFYSKTLETHLFESIEILADMLINPLLAEKDIDTERKVVLEEINMSEDNPETLVMEGLFQAAWGKSGLGNSILGNKESIESFDSKVLNGYIQRCYSPKNTVLAVSGKFDRDALIACVQKAFAGYRNPEFSRADDTVIFEPGISLKRKNMEQNHICLAFPSFELGCDDNYPLAVFNTICASGMSSRLFQRLREELGLVYSVDSFVSAHVGGGLFGVYAAFAPSMEGKTLETTMEELKRLKDCGITANELYRAKEQLKANIVMGMESTSSRASHMGKGQLLLGRWEEIGNIAAKIDNVTLEDVERVTRQVLCFDRMAVSVVGKPKKEKDYQKLRKE